jgi:hypothetical protein
MRHQHRQARLFLNGKPVGEVLADAASDAWGFGRFKPADEFSSFAPLFGAWSLLIHEDDQDGRVREETLDGLRAAEAAIDMIRAELLWLDTQQRTPVRQITIDGGLIEWNLGSPSSRE